MSGLLVVTNDFPPRRGGIESFVAALCERLPAEELVVYTAAMPGAGAYDRERGFPVYRDPSGMLLPSPSVRRRVVEVLHRHDCDRVVFGASAPLGLLAPALRRAGAGRIVALTHGHEVWWARVPVARSLLRRIGDSVDAMTYVSEWCRDSISPALSPRAQEGMRRLSPGVDLARFHPGSGGMEVRTRLGIPTEAEVVVCTARLVQRKGQDTLVEAWPEVVGRRPDARLLIVGDGPARRSLERRVAALGLAGSVTFTGSVAWEEVPAYTDAGDVFAMPCRTRRWGLEPEAWGIVSLEAQACGLPVLIGDSGGAPETLMSPFGGRVVTRSDEVAEAVVELLDVAPARGERRVTVPRSLSWDAVAARLEALVSG